MTRILLLRHAAHDLAGRALAGRLPGLALNVHGRAQAQALVQPLARRGLQAVYSSPQPRAQQTAAPLAQHLGLAVRCLDAFDEIDFGDWTGRSFGDAREHDPGAWTEWVERRSRAQPPRGEPFAGVARRTQDGVQRLARDHPEGVVLVVSHADVIKATLAVHLGMSLDDLERFDIACGSLSELEVGPGWAQVKLVNWVYERDVPPPSSASPR